MKLERQLLHLGCGPLARETRWIDLDGSWNARLNQAPKVLRATVRKLSAAIGGGKVAFPEHVRYFDLTKPLPFENNSVDGVYASHVWEHLYWDTAVFATSEAHRVLKPGGLIRLAVPNLKEMIAEYLNNSDPRAARTLQKRLLFHPDAPAKNSVYRLYQCYYSFHHHKVMYDPALMIDLLASAGFRNATERGPMESGIEEIGEVEREVRVGEGMGFAVEAAK